VSYLSSLFPFDIAVQDCYHIRCNSAAILGRYNRGRPIKRRVSFYQEIFDALLAPKIHALDVVRVSFAPITLPWTT